MEIICRPSMRGIFKSEISSGIFSVSSNASARLAVVAVRISGRLGKSASTFAAELEPVGVVVENQNFVPVFHSKYG